MLSSLELFKDLLSESGGLLTTRRPVGAAVIHSAALGDSFSCLFTCFSLPTSR